MRTEERQELAFPMLGRRLSVAGADAELGGWLRSRWEFAEHGGLPVADEIRVRVVRLPAARGEERRAATAWDAPRELSWHGRPIGWEVSSGGGSLRLRHDRRGSRIVIGAPGGAVRGGLRHALHLALGQAMQASGLVPLHCAAIHRNGEVTALLGSSGAGKSTTLLQAVRSGWAPVAEDVAWLDPATMQLYGWDRRLRISISAQRQFAPELSAEPWDRDARGKLLIPYEKLKTAGVRSGTLIRIVLLEQKLTEHSRWENLSLHEGVRALWEATGVPLSATARRRLSTQISGLLGLVQLSKLCIGSTPLPL